MLGGRWQVAGFTLIELLLVSAVSGVLIVSWTGFISQQLVPLNARSGEARQLQQLRSVGFWLSHELERARDNGDWDWVWHAAQQCLLFGSEAGVRLRDNRLLWRGGTRACSDNGWVALTEASNVTISGFALEQTATGSWLSLSAHIGSKVETWSYRFNGPVEVRNGTP